MDGIKTRDTVKILVIKTLCVKILVIKTCLLCQDFGDQDQICQDLIMSRPRDTYVKILVIKTKRLGDAMKCEAVR